MTDTEDMAAPLELEEDVDRERVRTALDELPAMYRETARRRFLLGYSLREIASELGVNSQTVSSRVHRARELLKEKLGK